MVYDERHGLNQSFEGSSLQMCEFSQAANLSGHLTENRKLKAAHDLLALANPMN
jgi:hypothetical protein